ncbi:hypothetical protein QBC43DRAFT_300477 [Cladorrhinum sp. PSN259]|nr:hypothetical protein QBC43DRAFT_300477 [Cladorrhinum sp. PSN259]
MEVAGLLLGGIPIVLYAIDNYHKCLQWTDDFWRYESTLKLLRSHVFVQQQQLQITLRSIGLVDPRPYELEEYLRQRYPDKFEVLTDIISHMEKLLSKLMDKLDVDSQGRPKWTTEPPDRAIWEWRRVRRGFSRSSRQKLIEELQFWNDALKNCFDKAELPLDNDTPTSAVDTMRSKYDSASCNRIRQRASKIHQVLSRSWLCQSHQQHSGNLKLPWHTGDAALTKEEGLSLLFPYKATGSSQYWCEVSCDVIEAEQIVAPPISTTHISLATTGPAPDPTSHEPQSPSHRPWKKLKGLFQASDSPKEAKTTNLPAISAITSTSSSTAIALPNPAFPLYSRPPQLPPTVKCLCSFTHGVMNIGRLVNKSSTGNSLHVQMKRLEQPRFSSAVPLATVFDQAAAGLILSRKDRFAFAAAATWAVLLLSGSPWIGPEWNGKDGLQLLTELHAMKYQPAVSCTFSGLGSLTRGQDELETTHAAGNHSNTGSQFIRNRTLFVLGVLLIELSLNKPFEKLREEYLSSSLSASLGMGTQSMIDDFEVANMCMQRVYLEAGDLYGYAVQRCLRCEFPGRDITKSFEFEQFRTDFFHGVVAPVQVTFNLLQAMHEVSQRV